jgi:membrane-associated phospholipid phosphatase
VVPRGIILASAPRAAAVAGAAIATLATGAARGQAAGGASSTEPAAATAVPTPIDGLGRNVAEAFSGTSLLLHGGAVAGTLALAASGADHALRVEAQQNLRWPAFGNGAVWVGYVLPVVVAPGIYLWGLAAGNNPRARAGAAAVQALVVTTATTFALKWITGRPFPSHGGDPAAPDRLEHPEYAREASFWPQTTARGVAWPSGHTSAAFSVAAALTSSQAGRLWVPLVAYPVATAIGAGMIVGDHHWASDVLAGALLGQAVGWAVGRGFRAAAGGDGGASVAVLPAPGGLVAMGSFLS